MSSEPLSYHPPDGTQAGSTPPAAEELPPAQGGEQGTTITRPNLAIVPPAPHAGFGDLLTHVSRADTTSDALVTSAPVTAADQLSLPPEERKGNRLGRVFGAGLAATVALAGTLAFFGAKDDGSEKQNTAPASAPLKPSAPETLAPATGGTIEGKGGRLELTPNATGLLVEAASEDEALSEDIIRRWYDGYEKLHKFGPYTQVNDVPDKKIIAESAMALFSPELWQVFKADGKMLEAMANEAFKDGAISDYNSDFEIEAITNINPVTNEVTLLDKLTAKGEEIKGTFELTFVKNRLTTPDGEQKLVWQVNYTGPGVQQ